jgi:hypothetical protein
MNAHGGPSTLLVCALLGAPAAEAQERVSGVPSGLTTLSVGIGLSVGSSEAGSAFEIAIGRHVVGRVRAELAGSYLDRGPAAEARSARISVLLDLDEGDLPAIPYFAASVGIYHADLELSGEASEGEPGGRSGHTYSHVPSFYADRLGPTSQAGRHRHFTDPMVAVGGGVRWDLTRRLFLRPEGRALMVLSHNDTLVVGVFTLNVAFKF